MRITLDPNVVKAIMEEDAFPPVTEADIRLIIPMECVCETARLSECDPDLLPGVQIRFDAAALAQPLPR